MLVVVVFLLYPEKEVVTMADLLLILVQPFVLAVFVPVVSGLQVLFASTGAFSSQVLPLWLKPRAVRCLEC